MNESDEDEYYSWHNCLCVELLQRAPADLLMNQADNYLHIQEQRTLLDRVLPFVENGKGCKMLA